MKLYGLIGYPLTHSFSEKYFSEKFQKQNITDSTYKLFPLSSIHELTALIKVNPDLCGLNVTIPYKESVMPFLDELDQTAKEVGAVNCIKITNGKLIGYNTDVFGFRQSIKPFIETQHQRALILGTGGASKAVQYVLKQIGIDCYLVTRDKSKMTINNCFEYKELNNYVLDAFKLIVNTTPLGMYPNTNTFPEIPYELLGNQHLLYDLVYNPSETEFMKKGKSRGAVALNGLSMLHQQAEEAWRIWNQ